MASEIRRKYERPAGSAADDRVSQQRMPRANDPARRDDAPYNPFSLMRQGVDEMDRWFSRLTGSGIRAGRRWMTEVGQTLGEWSPAIEAFHRGNDFVVRAELPGMNRTDVSVEVGDDSLTIRGERKQERQDERDGMFWSERSYGSFCRVVPLPAGAIGDSAKASFNNGVLEVVMPAPPAESRRGRRIDIRGSAEA